MAAVAVTVPMLIEDKEDPWKSGESKAESRVSIASNDRTLDGIPQMLRPNFARATRLPIIDKINELAFNEIDDDDVMGLILCLSPEPQSDNKLHLSRLRLFLCSPLLENSLQKDEADLLLADLMDSRRDEESTMLSCQDILECLHNSDGSREFLKMRQVDNTPAKLTREALAEHIKDVTERNDAFITLPITVFYVGLFLYLVMGHLRIFDRQLLEKSMEEYVNGRDPRETADENVDDIDSWWEWVIGPPGPGTRGPFGKVVNSTKGFDHCIMASRNILVGDVQISYEAFNGTSGALWLLQSSVAKAYLSNHSGEYQAAAVEAAKHYQNIWSDSQISYLYLRFNGYNEFERMFSMTEVWLPLRPSGHARTRINTDALSVEAYPSIYLLILDIVFLLLVGYIFFGEAKEAMASLVLGCGEFVDYLQFWNIVDWINITLTSQIVLLWVLIVGAMHPKPFLDLLDDDYKLKVDVMRLNTSQLDELDDCLKHLRRLYLACHFMMAVNTASVVLKFFKAFESNLRLRVVTDTFKAALDDLVHFFITFSTIYLPFCLIAHIMFGSDIADFASIVASLNAGFVVLMGDFGWYVDATAGLVMSSTLPSGMPVFILMAWYWAYMFLMFLVLLNMLLAVVMEHYIKVVGKLNDSIEKPTIFEQAKQYLRFLRRTRKFKPLMSIRMDLENDLQPAHPQEDVTKDSLIESWPDMKEEQAEWILDWLTAYIEKRDAQEVDKETQIQELGEANRTLALENASKIDELCKEVLGNKSRIDDMTSAVRASHYPVAGEKGSQSVTSNNYQQEMDNLNGTLRDLISSLGKVRKDQERLARRVEELALAVPQDPKLVKIAGGGKKLDLSGETDLPSDAPAISSGGRKELNKYATSPDTRKELNKYGTTPEPMKEKKEKKEKREKDRDKQRLLHRQGD